MNFDRMRALLLEQAVQGKLVPQLEDEPAVEQIGEAPNVGECQVSFRRFCS